ncbi:hypothetical protein D3C76_1552880 [compost metagenome]
MDNVLLTMAYLCIQSIIPFIVRELGKIGLIFAEVDNFAVLFAVITSLCRLLGSLLLKLLDTVSPS